MADRTFWVEVEDEDALHGIDSASMRMHGGAKNIIDDLSEYGVIVLFTHVPNYTSYTQRHVDRERAAYRPGGAGGGGEYEGIVGIKAGTSRHPIYVERGTKPGYTGKGSEVVNYGTSQPRTVPSRMYFFSERYGRVIGVREVEGQEAQRFFYRTWIELLAYARARLLTR